MSAGDCKEFFWEQKKVMLEYAIGCANTWLAAIVQSGKKQDITYANYMNYIAEAYQRFESELKTEEVADDTQ